MLDERKLRVLYAIIESYIASAEPIGSRTLTKSFDLGVSPATIRNEMSDLEDMGYISKTHSSSGRVPSDKAYRLYVDEILKLDKLSIDMDYNKNEKIKEILTKELWNIDEFVQNTAKILSSITNYTTVVVHNLYTSRIKQIQLLAIEELGILVVIVLNNGMIKNSILKIVDEITQEELNIISNYLNEKLKDIELNQSLALLNKNIFVGFYLDKDFFDDLRIVIRNSIDELISIELCYEGIMNILNFPEYRDTEKAKSFVSLMEDKDLLINILRDTSMSQNINIIIGQENTFSPIKDLSIITATYSLEDKKIGKVGLIGPTRMDYHNLIKVLRVFSTQVSDLLDSSD